MLVNFDWNRVERARVSAPAPLTASPDYQSSSKDSSGLGLKNFKFPNAESARHVFC